jgi:hypothetical protein
VLSFFVITDTSAPGKELYKENFVRVESGMALSEVENLLGGPAGDYGKNCGGRAMMTCEGFFVPGATEKIWFDDSTQFEIWFDTDDNVAGKNKRANFSRAVPDLMDRIYIAWSMLIHYWMITVPLTVFFACLLLWKLRDNRDTRRKFALNDVDLDQANMLGIDRVD